MDDNTITTEQAIELFDQQKYREALAAFTEIYDRSQDENEREVIFQILNEAFYDPNKEELRANYERNVQTLEQYPYFWNKSFRGFDELPFRLFPVSDEYFYCYDKEKDCFFGEYDAATRYRMRYFFEELDEPLRVENEDNLYNLNFLKDNVRASEDYAGDNHIYLLYDTPEPLERLMLTCDLEPILKKQKFVFLVGEDERKRYPIDFKNEFGIDYDKMSPQKLRIEEMQRICFWYKRGYSGAFFGLNLLNHNRYIMMRLGYDLFKSRVKGLRLFDTNLPTDVMKDTAKIYTLNGLEILYNHPDFEWGVEDFADFIQWLKRSSIDQFTLPELFRAYFIYKYHKDKPHMNPRIVPVILWEPHINNVNASDHLVLDFPYRTVLSSMRDPIIMAGRTYQREGSIWISQHLAIGLSMPEELREDYYGYRFEDAKLYPEETCRALCETLNVPYDPDMLNNDEEMEGINGEPAIRGFDTAPLHRNVDEVFSKFDQCRLQIFFDSILRHFGYPTFDFEECPMEENDITFLFKFPFRFEKDYVEKGKWEKVTQEQLRQGLFSKMFSLWLAGKRGELVFPKVIKPKILDES